MSNLTTLNKLQREIMEKFYSIDSTKVIFNKKERNNLWKITKSREQEIDFDVLNKKCPALSHQIKKSYDSGKNIQSAVFSECVYAQTLANMLKLDNFMNCLENDVSIPEKIKNLLKYYNLFPRYLYTNSNKTIMLVQAGGCNGIDSALINVENLSIYTIEFKEPSAKTSEPDLPKFKEDGKLVITEDFIKKYPQFEEMLNEQKDLNFFEIMGSNVKNFSNDSVNIAVSNNYTKKYADVICTEDVNGYLVMIPVNQVSLWAKIEGEIRATGKNRYKVWTPIALRKFLIEKKAKIEDNNITINKDQLGLRKERGGNGKVSGYKITSLFFVYLKDCNDLGNSISFNINDIWEVNPTITGKLFFKKLKYKVVKEYYGT